MKEIHCFYCGNPVEPSQNREVGQDWHEDCRNEAIEIRDKFKSGDYKSYGE